MNSVFMTNMFTPRKLILCLLKQIELEGLSTILVATGQKMFCYSWAKYLIVDAFWLLQHHLSQGLILINSCFSFPNFNGMDMEVQSKRKLGLAKTVLCWTYPPCLRLLSPHPIAFTKLLGRPSSNGVLPSGYNPRISPFVRVVTYSNLTIILHYQWTSFTSVHHFLMAVGI